MSDSIITSTDPTAPKVPPRTPYWFFVEGIENNTNDCRGWHLEAERWFERNTPFRADNLAYHVKFWNRWVHQKKVIDDLYYCLSSSLGPPTATVDENRPWGELRMVGHSNGCPVILEMFNKYPEAHCKELHLVAGAALADCDANHLNKLAANGQVERVFIWVSESDTVLQKWARASRRFFGFAGLGYGDLGYTGPQNMSPKLTSIFQLVPRPGYRHSDYFVPAHFEDTMRFIATMPS